MKKMEQLNLFLKLMVSMFPFYTMIWNEKFNLKTDKQTNEQKSAFIPVEMYIVWLLLFFPSSIVGQ